MELNIIEVVPDKQSYGFMRSSFFIDVPIDVELEQPACKRIEIPRALARYIHNLQQDNMELRRKLSSKDKGG